MLLAQSCLILYDPMDCNPQASLSMEFSRYVRDYQGQSKPININFARIKEKEGFLMRVAQLVDLRLDVLVVNLDTT